MWSDDELDEQAQGKRKLRGWIAYDLTQDLAFSGLTQQQLADKYGVTQQSISDFKRRNAERIAEVIANKDDALAGLWIAKKERRVSEYQRDVERINETETLDAQQLRVKHNALRSVAEELNQLKSHVEVDSKVHYSIEGIDPDKLK